MTKQMIKAHVTQSGLPDWYINRYRGKSWSSAGLNEKLLEDLKLMEKGELRIVDRYRFSENENKDVMELIWELKRED